MPIKVIVAKPHGYCGNKKFGVIGAIEIAKKTAKKYKAKTYMLGEIVHNQHVVDWLEKKYNIKTVASLNKIPKKAVVIIRAHGAAPQTYKQAKARDLKIVDATCPLVAKAHQEVKRLAKLGKKILYISSKKTHDEAVGVVAQAPKAIMLTTLQELDKVKIADPKHTVVLTQTTLSILETTKALKKLKSKYPELTIKPHICLATSQRQKAIIKLAKKIGMVVIVGSPASSNSNRLRETAEQVGAKAYIVDTAKELDSRWFKGVKNVVVSSGASTPEWLMDEVVEKIKKLNLKSTPGLTSEA